MKEINFLKNLKKEGRIELVESSNEIAKSYLLKSESNLVSAKILLANNRLEEAVGLAYYSMYHILGALLFKIGVKSENHSASIILLKELFNLDNKEIFYAKTERVDKQYYVDFIITKEEVQDMIKKSEIFNNNMIDFISKINLEDIKIYRTKLLKMLY